MRKDIVFNDQICAPAVGRQFPCKTCTEESNFRWDAALNRCFGHICGWLDSQYRNPSLDKILKQISIVACNLHNPAVVAQFEPVSGDLGICPGVLQPRV